MKQKNLSSATCRRRLTGWAELYELSSGTSSASLPLSELNLDRHVSAELTRVYSGAGPGGFTRNVWQKKSCIFPQWMEYAQAKCHSDPLQGIIPQVVLSGEFRLRSPSLNFIADGLYWVSISKSLRFRKRTSRAMLYIGFGKGGRNY